MRKQPTHQFYKGFINVNVMMFAVPTNIRACMDPANVNLYGFRAYSKWMWRFQMKLPLPENLHYFLF